MSVGVSSTDDETRTGWSVTVTVTVTGTARALGPVLRPGDAGADAPQPWAPGTKDHVLAVPLEDVTGRRIVTAAPLGSGEPAWGWWG